MKINKALIVIDVQNEYFEKGPLPLWNMEQTINNIVDAITNAQTQNISVILVQHIANLAAGESPFFNSTQKALK